MKDAEAADRIAQKIRIEMRVREMLSARGIPHLVRTDAVLTDRLGRRANRATRRAYVSKGTT